MIKNEINPYTVTVGICDKHDNLIKAFVLGDEHVTFTRKLGRRGWASNAVMVLKGGSGLGMVVVNPELHHFRFVNTYRQEARTHEAAAGFHHIIPGDEMQIDLKSRIKPASNNYASMYVIFDRADPSGMERAQAEGLRNKAK